MIKVYHKNGQAFTVKSVKAGHFKTITGRQGAPSYALTFKDGQTLFYPVQDILSIERS